MVLLTAVAVVLVVLGGVASAQAGAGLRRTTTVIDGVPLTLVRPADDSTGHPAAVVVHGYAGSARLMQPFADTLARNGYVVVLPDLAGDGASTRPIADPSPDLDVAVRFLRAQPGVDAGRTVLVGHSRGADAVIAYAGMHQDIAATVAVSADEVPARQPHNLLVLYGQFEEPTLGDIARRSLGVDGGDPGRTYGSVADGTARRVDAVPGVEHLSILFSPTAHAWTLAWLNATVRPGAAPGSVHPLSRLWPAALLLLGLLVGFIPLAAILFRRNASASPHRPDPARTAASLLVGGVAGVVAGVAVPDPVLRQEVGGWTALVLAAFAVAAALTHRFAPVATFDPHPDGRRPTWSEGGRAVLLAGYATAMVAVPVQLGVTWVVPNAARALPLAASFAAVWLLFGAAERLCGGRWYLHACVLASACGLLYLLAVLGVGPDAVMLVLPLLAGLLAIGAAVAALLRRLALPGWLAAAIAAPVFAWTVAMTLPLS
jgi:dienelactone hydrolase